MSAPRKKVVAVSAELPEDWLNRAAKAFVPPNAGVESWRVLGNLSISVADAPRRSSR
jgi:hypothetical protein